MLWRVSDKPNSPPIFFQVGWVTQMCSNLVILTAFAKQTLWVDSPQLNNICVCSVRKSNALGLSGEPLPRIQIEILPEGVFLQGRFFLLILSFLITSRSGRAFGMLTDELGWRVKPRIHLKATLNMRLERERISKRHMAQDEIIACEAGTPWGLWRRESNWWHLQSYRLPKNRRHFATLHPSRIMPPQKQLKFTEGKLIVTLLNVTWY